MPSRAEEKSKIWRHVLCAPVLVMVTLLLPLRCPAQAHDWQAEVRRRVAAKDLTAALAIADRRLAEAPLDLEARGWRARLLSWTGRTAEAEAEYRHVLEAAPNDTDILIGLANVLAAQQRYTEALALLDRARELDTKRGDLHTSRGRALRALGRTAEAHSEFREALNLNPADADAKAGLASVEPAPHHQFVFATDFDVFNTAAEAQSYTFTLRSDISSRWITNLGGNFQNRFGEQPARFLGSLTYRITRNDALTVGGAAGRDRGVISKGEAFFDYGRGFRLSSRGMFRGLEANYQQKWLWFDAARVLTLTPSVLFYLPKDWTWSVQVTAARSRFPGTSAEWRPSGMTRLTFPVHRRLTVNTFFAVGTENFARVDQVGRFSARTWGGGARYEFARRQDVSFYALYQDRSQGRTQTSFGFAYGLRF